MPYFLVLAFIGLACLAYVPMAVRWQHGMGWQVRCANAVLGAVLAGLILFFPTLGGWVHWYTVEFQDGDARVQAVFEGRQMNAECWVLRPLLETERTSFYWRREREDIRVRAAKEPIVLQSIDELPLHAAQCGLTRRQAEIAASLITAQREWEKGPDFPSTPPSETLASKAGCVLTSGREGHSDEMFTMACIIVLAGGLGLWNGRAVLAAWRRRRQASAG